MVFYHASPVPDISVLEPRTSQHGTPLVYLSDRRENVLVYLVNPVEKFCRESGLPAQSSYYKFAPYGFTEEGLLRLDEYWPGATEETFRGASGYIYTVRDAEGLHPLTKLPHAFSSEKALPVSGCEFVPDAYEALLQAQRAGKLVLTSFRENSEHMLEWIEKMAWREYEDPGHPAYYRAFLKTKFPFLKER